MANRIEELEAKLEQLVEAQSQLTDQLKGQQLLAESQHQTIQALTSALETKSQQLRSGGPPRYVEHNIEGPPPPGRHRYYRLISESVEYTDPADGERRTRTVQKRVEVEYPSDTFILTERMQMAEHGNPRTQRIVYADAKNPVRIRWPASYSSDGRAKVKIPAPGTGPFCHESEYTGELAGHFAHQSGRHPGAAAAAFGPLTTLPTPTPDTRIPDGAPLSSVLGPVSTPAAPATPQVPESFLPQNSDPGI